MDKVVLKSLHISTFRHLNNIDIPFGKKLTVISGVNGIGKSCLLGLVGHMFKFKDRDEHEKEYRSLLNKRFYTEFSEIFKFSNSEKDYKYLYHLETVFNEEDYVKKASSRYLDKDKRFRIDVAKDKGGKYDFPVVYLSLKRLFPLAQERTIRRTSVQLDSTSIDSYIHLGTKILASTEQIEPQKASSRNKTYIAPTTDIYDVNGLSAGQDNLGQILSALFSFNILKTELEKQKKSYYGGILLVDELDATLFPGSQVRLLDILLSFAAKLNLQIIFTTHSPEILKRILVTESKKYLSDCKVVFLHKVGQHVEAETDLNSYESFIAELNNTTPESNTKRDKISVYVEDEEAALWFKYLAPSSLKKYLHLETVWLGKDEYQHLLSKKTKWFNKSIIVLDGDAKIKKPFKNLLRLPGKKSPEVIFHQFLDSLDDNEKEDFWGKKPGTYKKSVFMASRLSSDELKDRNKTKKWFKDNLQYWGTGACKLFKRWQEDERNKKEYDEFVLNLRESMAHFIDLL